MTHEKLRREIKEKMLGNIKSDHYRGMKFAFDMMRDVMDQWEKMAFESLVSTEIKDTDKNKEKTNEDHILPKE